MNATTLESKLDQLKRRATLVGLGAGAGRGMAVALLVVIVGMWLDLLLDLAPRLRVGCALVAVAAAVGLVVTRLRAARRQSQPALLAGRMDQAAGSRGQILAGVDLALYPVAGASGISVTLTAGLAAMAVRRAEALAAGVPAATVVPAKPAARAASAAGAILLAVAVVALIAPRFFGALWLRFSDPFGDHPPYSRVTLDVRPGDAKVVYGGTVDLHAAAAGGPVERVDLVLRSVGTGTDETLPMFLESDGTWRATLTNITAAGEYFVRAGGARSRRFKLDVVTVPKIEAVTVRVTPPAYTRRPPYEGPTPPGGIAGLPGTRVDVRAKSNRPLGSGRMEVAAENSKASPANVAMNPVAAGASEVSGSFVLTAAGKVTVGVTDTAGQSSVETFTAPLTLLADERPFVRILEPRPNSLATPDVVVPVVLAAEDDYGISRLQLFRSLNDSRAIPIDLPLPSPAPARHGTTVQLPLAAYGLSPGDVIKLYARVEDNDPAGPKGSESGVVVLQIISQEDFQRMAMARAGLEVLESKYLQAARRVEAAQAEMAKLQEELKKAGGSPLADELRKKIEALAEKMRQDANEIREAAATELPIDLDKALSEQLKKMADALDDAGKAAEAAAGLPSSAGAAEALEKLQRALGERREEFKKEALDPLAHLAQIFPLLQDEARFIQLYQRQRDLADRLASLAGQDGGDDPKLKARMRDLEAEQHQLRESLATLLDDIENHANQLPDDDDRLVELKRQALEIAKAVRVSGAAEAMAAGEGGLAEFSGTRGHDGAKQAADILEQFISKEEGLGATAGACLSFNPKLAACLGNSVAQLLGAAGLGMNQGNGAGGGYSASASTLQNTSIYGKMPLTGGPPRAGGDRRDGGGRGASGAGGPSSPGDEAATSANGQAAGAAQAEGAVPARYKRRVGDYFRRVADELEEK